MENPVFINELRQSPFRRNVYQYILVWITVTALIIYSGSFLDPRYLLFWMPIVVLPIIVPSFTAGLFAKEYEQQTWQDLTLTRLTNAQVVLGKFLAALVQIGAIFLMLISPLFTNMILDRQLFQIVFTPRYFVDYLFKLFLSASLYIMLAMVCSRYCSNRRTALIWCYITLFIYAALGCTVWSVLSGTLNPSNSMDSVVGDFMQGIHLIFCSVVGLGGWFLLWVSLSEQRGYARTDDGISRGWQPIAKERVPQAGQQK